MTGLPSYTGDMGWPRAAGLLWIMLPVAGCSPPGLAPTAGGSVATTQTLDSPVLPPELAFLKEMDPEPDNRGRLYRTSHRANPKVSVEMFRTHYAGAGPVEGYEQEFVCPYYEFVEDPQRVAHRLKAELTKERGWTLSFPQVGSYGATALQVKNGVEGLELKFVPGYDHRGMIYLWDRDKPLRSRGAP